MDMKTVFLYKTIDLLFIKTLKGYYNNLENMVYKLNKALYGLKQSPWLWYERFSSFYLKKLDLTCINTNHSIFIAS